MVTVAIPPTLRLLPPVSSIITFPCCSKLVGPRKNRSFHCSAGYPEPRGTPPLLKLAVTGFTDLLRFLSQKKRRMWNRDDGETNEGPLCRSVDDVLQILRKDYARAYFLTGKDQYAQNLDLLVPFFEYPSLVLQKIEKGCNSGTDYIIAEWRLRTYLKVPWRPLISILGTTTYNLDAKFKIVRHTESWNISPLEAIGQIFTPGPADADVF